MVGGDEDGDHLITLGRRRNRTSSGGNTSNQMTIVSVKERKWFGCDQYLYGHFPCVSVRHLTEDN